MEYENFPLLAAGNGTEGIVRIRVDRVITASSLSCRTSSLSYPQYRLIELNQEGSELSALVSG